LETGCFEGNAAETTTLVPIITAFRACHDVGDTPMVVAADAGMLSASNLAALDEAELEFIVGSRVVRPRSIWHPTSIGTLTFFTDGQIIDTVTPRHDKTTVNDANKRDGPVGKPDNHTGAWRAIWAYSAKRARRDQKTLHARRPAPKPSSQVTEKPKSPGSSKSPPVTAPSTKPPWPAHNPWSG
jgi:hypothetical protein